MPEFITPVEVTPFSWRSDHSKKHLLIGSCFTENIGSIMEGLKLPVMVNPFGILYNPVSVARALRRMLSGEAYTEKDLFEHDGLWHSTSHHGSFSAATPARALAKINGSLEQACSFLREADFLIITLGTSRVYELRKTGETVANCHKVPAREFHRTRLSVAETVTVMKEALEKIWQANPSLKIILTISPVRHIQDGAAENQLSKAVLLLAADTLEKGFGREKCACFPAYEIMMDELRDYRFYQSDMIHPSPVAVDYIWRKFSDAFLTPQATALGHEIAGLRKATAHRPLYPHTPQFQLFIKHSLEKTLLMAKNHPTLDFSREIDYFSKQNATDPLADP